MAMMSEYCDEQGCVLPRAHFSADHQNIKGMTWTRPPGRPYAVVEEDVKAMAEARATPRKSIYDPVVRPTIMGVFLSNPEAQEIAGHIRDTAPQRCVQGLYVHVHQRIIRAMSVSRTCWVVVAMPKT